MARELEPQGAVHSTSFKFGAFDVEPARNCLRLGDRRFTLEPRIMDLLCVLGEKPGEVLSRHELIDRVWRVAYGADESLTRAISILRKTVSTAGEADVYIETIPKRGYRITQPVARQVPPGAVLPSGDVGISASAPPVRSASSHRYSVAVLPIETRSPGTRLEWVADAVARDLTDLLARAPRLRVACYGAASSDELARLSVTKAGRMLDVGYVVCGSIGRLDDRIQLRIALVDVATGSHLWSRRTDAPAGRFHAVLDEFISDVATSMLSEIQLSQALTIGKRDHADLDSHEILQTTEMLRVIYSQHRAEEIVAHLDLVLDRDPDNALAHAGLAVQLAQNVVSRWTRDGEESFTRASEHIAHARMLAPNDPDVLAATGIVATMMGDSEAAVRHLGRAVRRDPNNPHTLAVLGWQRCWLHGDEAGIEMIRTAERRAPHHPRYSLWAFYRAMCEARLDRFEAALAAYRTSVDRNPNYHLVYIGWASVLAYLGRDEEAKAAVAEALELNPRYKADDWGGPPSVFPHMYGTLLDRETARCGLRRIWPKDAG